nr:hypothetical protein [Kibdelosporangium sp. MJ126-NF4]CTQ99240.1 hypothetical protein [Kibdelosporangium sp. MJ126-NF4]
MPRLAPVMAKSVWSALKGPTDVDSTTASLTTLQLVLAVISCACVVALVMVGRRYVIRASRAARDAERAAEEIREPDSYDEHSYEWPSQGVPDARQEDSGPRHRRRRS